MNKSILSWILAAIIFALLWNFGAMKDDPVEAKAIVVVVFVLLGIYVARRDATLAKSASSAKSEDSAGPDADTGES